MSIDSQLKSGILHLAYELVKDTREATTYAGFNVSIEDRVSFYVEHLPPVYNSLCKAFEGKVK